jgi:hypothetical protein
LGKYSVLYSYKKSFYDEGMMEHYEWGKAGEKEQMNKPHIIYWQTMFVLTLFLFVSSVAQAIKPSHSSSSQLLECQTSLKRFSLHLEKCKTRSNQAYYEDLYNQAQNMLSTFNHLPASSSQLTKCENLLKALHDIVGSPTVEADLGPMPSYDSAYTGKLTMPALEARRRPINRNMHVRYVCEDHSSRKRNDEGTGDMEELDDYPLHSRPTPHISRMRRGNVPGEAKAHKELE